MARRSLVGQLAVAITVALILVLIMGPPATVGIDVGPTIQAPPESVLKQINCGEHFVGRHVGPHWVAVDHEHRFSHTRPITGRIRLFREFDLGEQDWLTDVTHQMTDFPSGVLLGADIDGTVDGDRDRGIVRIDTHEVSLPPADLVGRIWFRAADLAPFSSSEDPFGRAESP